MTESNAFPIPQITSAATALASEVQALTEAVRTTCADPADAIRILSELAAFAPSSNFGSDAVGSGMATMQTANAAMCRRAALTSLARAAVTYAPSSYQDAVTLRTNVCALFDAEAITAADAGDNASYVALKAMRAAVSADITTRAGSLAMVTTVNRRTSLPALVVAYQLYQDASRSDDLVARNDPRSPLFMPLTLEALAS